VRTEITQMLAMFATFTISILAELPADHLYQFDVKFPNERRLRAWGWQVDYERATSEFDKIPVKIEAYSGSLDASSPWLKPVWGGNG
jgi:hypothetical protein